MFNLYSDPYMMASQACMIFDITAAIPHVAAHFKVATLGCSPFIPRVLHRDYSRGYVPPY